MFCKYCGKEIPDGGVCGCEGAAKAETKPIAAEESKKAADDTQVSSSPSPSTEETVPASVQNKGASSQTGAETVVSINVSAIKTGLLGLVKKAFKQPVNYLKAAYNQADAAPQYAIGIFYAVILFLLPLIEYRVVLGDLAQYSKGGGIVKFSFFLTLAIILCKAVVTAVPIVLNKKPWKNMVGMVCASSILPIVLRIVISLGLMLNLFGFAIAVIGLNIAISLIYDYEILTLGFNYNKDKVFWIFIITEVIVGIVAYVIGYNMALDAVKQADSFIGSMF